MIEIIVNKNKEEKIIAVIENGKLVEIYEENEQSRKARNEGNIYIGVVKDIIPGMQAAFVDIGTDKNSFIHVKDIVPQVDEKVEKRIDTKIKEVAKVGQKILIQIQKDSNDKKGARTSTHIKLTGNTAAQEAVFLPACIFSHPDFFPVQNHSLKFLLPDLLLPYEPH